VVERIVGSLSDIHPRKELEEQLRHNALYDAVTGLPNRTLFRDRLSHSIAQARRSPEFHYAVLFIDLDHFKVVNDTFGHPMGDRLLAEVGQRLRAGLREVDVASRFGGDEFAVLLHDIDPSRVRAAVERMQGMFQEPVDLDGDPVMVTASVGIATGATEYADADEVLRDADIAMYEAKETQRGSYKFFVPRWPDTNGDDRPDPAIDGSA
jgi:diguanylate cyclase (GGDEF)-like protein